MPKKTDGIPFELHPRPTRGADGKPLLYARPVKGRKIDLDYIDDFCAKSRNLHPGDVKHVFNKVMDVFITHLAEGYRIETPMGSMAPKLKLQGDHTDPKEIYSAHVIYDGLTFTPSRKFCEQVKERHKGCHKARAYAHLGDVHNEAAMKAALDSSMTNGYTTVKVFAAVARLAYTTAKDYLNGLCQGEKPLLGKQYVGRTQLYFYRKQ